MLVVGVQQFSNCQLDRTVGIRRRPKAIHRKARIRSIEAAKFDSNYWQTPSRELVDAPNEAKQVSGICNHLRQLDRVLVRCFKKCKRHNELLELEQATNIKFVRAH